MDRFVTRCGTLSGLSTFTSHADGSLKTCILREPNVLVTPIGTLVPQYRVAELGERQKKHRSSVECFESGQLKSLSLDQATPVQTPLGLYKAEFVTFHENGALNRIFPLNGLIDGYWSERNEGERAEFLDFELPIGIFKAKILSLHFYPSGALKSLTLWPGQKITLKTPLGALRIRTGFSLHEDGSLRLTEPADAVDLPTPLGTIKAFDPERIGMSADKGSLHFSPSGELNSLKTIHTGLRIRRGNTVTVLEPHATSSFINLAGLRTVPMQITFKPETLTVLARDTHTFDRATHCFGTFERTNVLLV